MSRLPRPICAGSIAAFLAVIAAAPSRTQAATVYWDTNSTGAGAGGVAPVGNWTGANWSSSSLGTATTSLWQAGDIAVFSAGADATGVYSISITGTQSIGGLIFEDGTTTLTGGSLSVASAVDFMSNSGVAARIDSAIIGSGSVRKTGLGTLRLGSAANAFTGGLTISSGVLSVTDIAALGGGSLPITVEGNNNRGQGGGVLVLGGTLASGLTVNRSLIISGGGPGAGGAALLSVGNNTITDLTTGTTASNIPYAAGGTTTVTSFLAGAGQNTQFNGPGNWILSGVTLSGQTNTLLQKAGNGGMIITGTNLIDNELRVSGGSLRIASGLGLPALSPDAGVLEIRTDTAASFVDTRLLVRGGSTTFVDRAVGSTSSLINQNIVFSDTSFNNNNVTLTFSGRNGYGITLTGAGNNTGPISFATGNQITVNNTANGLLTYAGNLSFTDGTARTYTFQGNGDSLITGSVLGTGGAHVLTKTGLGTFTIEGNASSYTGVTNINQGTLAARSFTSVGNGTINIGNATTTAGTLTYLGASSTGAGETTAKAIALNTTTAPVYLNASQSGSAPTALVINGTITNAAAGAKTLVLGGTSTLDNEISSALPADNGGALSLGKVGAGTWVLSGANGAFTGSVTITGGTLKVRDTFSGSSRNVLPNGSGITFDANSATAPFLGTLTAAGTFEYVGANNSASTETVGALTATAGAATVKVTPTGSGSAALTFASLATPAAGSSLNFTVPASASVILASATAGVQNLHATFNGADFAFASVASNATLRAINYGVDAGTNTVAAAGTLTASSHNLINTTSGTAGTVTAGNTIVSSLKFSGNTSLTGTGAITTPAILATGGSVSISSGGGITSGGATDLVFRVNGASDTLTLTNATAILGTSTGGITKNGAGKLVFGGNQSYSGATTINEGTLQMSTTSRLGTGTNNLVIRQAGTLDLNGVTSGSATVGAFNGAGSIINSGAATTLTVGGGGASGLFSGTISGGIGLIKTSTGTISLTGTNSFTGKTQIDGGTLAVTSLANIGSASGIGAGDSTNATTNAASLVFNSGTLQYTGSNAAIFQSTGTPSVKTDRLFTLAGSATIDSSGTFGNNVLASGTQNNAALIFSNTADVVFSGAGTRTLTLQGSSTGDNELRIRLRNNTNANEALAVTKTNGGLWILNPASANTYTGLTTISGGQLQAVDGVGVPTTSPIVLNGGSAVFQTSGNFTRSINASPAAGGGGVNFGTSGGGFAASSAKLSVNIGSGSALTWGSSAGIQGTLYLSSGTALAETEFKNSIDLGAAARTVQVDDNGNTALDFATMSGAISNGSLNKAGSGMLYLTGTNTYAGGTTLSAGTLVVSTIGTAAAPNSNLGAGTGALTLAGGTLMYTGLGETTDRTINLNASASIDASGAGPLVITNLVNSSGAKTLTLTGASSDVNEVRLNLVDNGGALSVTKSGAGIWVLSGTGNSYTGATNIQGGAIGVSNDNAFGSSSSIIVTNASLFASDADHSINRPVLFSGNATEGIFGDYNLTISGAVTFANSTASTTLSNFISVGKTFTISGSVTNADSANDRSLTINGAGNTVISGLIQDNSGNARKTGITYSGTALLTLTNASNAYTGPTAITSGVIQAQDGSGLSTGSNLSLSGGVFQITGPFNRALGTAAGQVQWASSGGFSAVGGNYTLTLNGGAQLVWAGSAAAPGANNPTASFVSGGNSLIFGSTTATSAITWTNSLDLNNTTGGVTRTITVNDNPAVSTDFLTITGFITQSSSGAVGLAKNGAGKLILETSAMNNSNAFGGTLTINGGDLVLRGSPTNGGALTMSPSATGTNLFIENGANLLRQGDFNASAGSAAGGITVSGNGTISLNATTGIVTRNFVINDNPLVTDDVVISVPLLNGAGAGVVHFTKQGAGKLVLSGDNTYQGATVHYKGTTVIDYSTSASEKLSDQGDLEMRGGTLILKGNNASAVIETVGNLSPGSSNLGKQNATQNLGPSTANVNSYGTLTGTASQGAGGASNIQLQPTTQPVTLTFGGFIRNAGGGVVQLSTTNGLGQFRSAVSGDTNNGNLLAVNALLNGRWLAQDGLGNIVPYTGVLQTDLGLWDATHSYELNNIPTGTLATNRIAGLIFSSAASPSLSIANPTAALTLTTAGLLVTPSSSAPTVDINGGMLMTELPYKTAAGADILIENYSPTTLLRISSNLGHSDAPQGNTPLITIAGPGTVELAGKSSSMLTYGTNGSNILRGAVKVIGGATLRVSGGDAISDYIPVDFGTAGDLAGNLVIADGQTEAIGGILNPPSTNQGVNNPNISLGTGGTLIINQAAAVTYNGTITGSGTFVKDGNATFTITNSVNTPITFNGSVEVRAGLLSLTGNLTNGLTNNITNILLRGGSIEAEHNGGGLLSINKLPDSTTVTLDGTSGSGLRIFSNTSGRTESISGIKVDSGANVVSVDAANTTSQLTLNLTNSNSAGALVRTGNYGTLLVRGDNLGGGVGGSLNNSARILLPNNGASLSLIGGDGSTPSNNPILPWAIGTAADPVAAAVGDSFVTYGPNGLRPLSTATNNFEYATSYASTGSTDNLSLNASVGSLTGKTINSLRLDTNAGAVSMSGSGTLTLASGAILMTAAGNTNAGSITGFSTLNAGSTNELVIGVTSSAANPTLARLTIDPVIQDTGNAVAVTKTGTGTLVLTGNNTFTGGLNVNQGVVEFSDSIGRDLGASGGAIRMAGGALKYAGSNTINLAGHPMQLLGASSFFTPTGTGTNGNLVRGSVFDTGFQTIAIAAPTGPGGLVKLGDGALNVGIAASAVSTYTGTTAVLRGTMNFYGISAMSGLFILPENIDGTDNNVVVSANVTNNLNVNQLIVGGVFSSTSTLTGQGLLTVGTPSVHPTVTIGNGSGDSYLLVGYHDEGAGNGASSSSFTRGTANFSNASSVTINTSRIFIGQNKGSGSGLTDGDMSLSSTGTNTITTGFFVIGDSPGPDASSNSGNISIVTLGHGANYINADSIIVGGQSSNGKLALSTGGTLTIRGRSGATGASGSTGSGGANLYIGDNDDINDRSQDQGGTTLDSTSGTIDALLNTLVVARHGGSSSASVNGGSRGALRFSNGTINASTVLLAQTSTRGTSTQGSSTLAEITQDGGTFTFGNMSKGGGDVQYNWTQGTISTFPGTNSVNQNVQITLGIGTGADFHDVLVPNGYTMTFGTGAGFRGNGFLSKSGGGTLILKGESTTGGDFAITAGKVFANNVNGSATGSSIVKVSPGAELGGSGNIGGTGATNANVLLFPSPGGNNPGGKLTVGANPGEIGNLKIGGLLSLEPGSILKLEISTGTNETDLLELATTLEIDPFNPDADLSTTATLELTNLNPGVLPEGQRLTIIKTGSGWTQDGFFKINGQLVTDYDATFNPNSTLFFVGGYGFRLDYNGGPQELDVQLISVPEPGALASLIGGMGMLLGLQRFRRWGKKA